MGSRSVVAAVCVSLLSVGSAGVCYARKADLDSEARWLMERGNAQAIEYAERLDNSVADAQFKTFAVRRSVMERSHQWQRGQLIGLMLGALSALVAYMLYLLKRLDSQLDEAASEAPPEPRTPPVTSQPSGPLVANPHR